MFASVARYANAMRWRTLLVLVAACSPARPTLGPRAAVVEAPLRLPERCEHGKRPYDVTYDYPTRKQTTLTKRAENRSGDYVDASGAPDVAGCASACAPAMRPGETVVSCYRAWAREALGPDNEVLSHERRRARAMAAASAYCSGEPLPPSEPTRTLAEIPMSIGVNDEVLVCNFR
jgi:hypothetical protein